MKEIIPLTFEKPKYRLLYKIQGKIQRKNEEVNWRPFRRQPISNISTTQNQAIIKLATLNVWFDAYFQTERNAASIANLIDLKADVIALQECTKKMLKSFTDSEFIRRNYVITDVKGDTFDAWYGVVLLISKTRPDICIESMQKLPYPETKMGRSLLLTHLLVGGKKVIFSTSHFESRPEDEPVRKLQFEFVTKYFEQTGGVCVMCGDFNIAFDDRESALLESLGWNDSCPDKSMMTFNPFKPDEEKKRLDRVVFRGAGIKIGNYSHFGDKPMDMPQSPKPVFASDHLGVCVEII